jgi:transposase
MRGAVHMQITTIGLDIAKNVFQVHGIDAAEKVIVRKRLRRSQVLSFFKALRFTAFVRFGHAKYDAGTN